MERYEMLNTALRPLDAAFGLGIGALRSAGLYDPFKGALQDVARKAIRWNFDTNHHLEVIGEENVPMSGGVLLAANHQSWQDAQALGVSSPRFVHFIAKSDFLEWPVLHQFFDLMDTVYIQRGGDKNGLDQIAQSLVDGECVGIFPEGTIPGEEDVPRWDVQRHTGLLRGRSGVVRLAIMAGVPVVPVGISGTGQAFPPEMFPRLQQLPLPRNEQVSVRFGKPLEFGKKPLEEVSREEMREKTDQVMRAISSLVDHSRAYVPVSIPLPEPKAPALLPPMPYKNEKPIQAKVGALVLHGFTSNIHCVDELVPYLEERNIPYRLPYLRGHGTRWEDMAGTTHRDWYDDAEAAMLDLLTECEKVVIIGLSMGGLVSLELAARHHATTAGVVPIAAALRFADPLAGLTPVLAKVLSSWPSPPAYNDKECERRHNRNYEKFATDAFSSLFDFTGHVDNLLSFVRAPIMVVAAEKDTVVAPKAAKLVYSRVSSRQKEIVWFEQTGHEMLLDLEKDAVCQTVDRFLGSIIDAETADA